MSEEKPATRINPDTQVEEFLHSDGEYYPYQEDPGVKKLREGGAEHVTREELKDEIQRVRDETDPVEKAKRDKERTEIT